MAIGGLGVLAVFLHLTALTGAVMTGLVERLNRLTLSLLATTMTATTRQPMRLVVLNTTVGTVIAIVGRLTAGPIATATAIATAVVVAKEGA